MIRCHQRAEICESGLSKFVAFFMKPSNIILENERTSKNIKIEVLYKMVKKKILAVARCWLDVSLLGCYIFQVRVSFLNTTAIFFKMEASYNEHSFNRFLVAV